MVLMLLVVVLVVLVVLVLVVVGGDETNLQVNWQAVQFLTFPINICLPIKSLPLSV